MSLYNQIFGYDLHAPMALALAALDFRGIPRFRDAMFVLENGEPVVLVYTRTGGPNRKEYEEGNQMLAQHPGYIRDEDMPNDNTYAYWYFKLPPKMLEDMGEDAKASLRAIAEATKRPHEKFAEFLQDMRDGTKTPATERGLELGRKLKTQLEEAFEGKRDPIIEV